MNVVGRRFASLETLSATPKQAALVAAVVVRVFARSMDRAMPEFANPKVVRAKSRGEVVVEFDSGQRIRYGGEWHVPEGPPLFVLYAFHVEDLNDHTLLNGDRLKAALDALLTIAESEGWKCEIDYGPEGPDLVRSGR